MPKYRKKPVVVEAYRLGDPDTSPDAGEDFHRWANDVGFTEWESCTEGVLIHTLEGMMIARSGDWIIQGVQGEFYPCKNEIFRSTYEPAFVDDSDDHIHVKREPTAYQRWLSSKGYTRNG